MPLNLASLSAKTKTISFEFEGEVVTMSVRTHLITPKMWANLKQTPDDDIDAVSRFLVDLIASWDVEGNDGTPFPLTVKALSSTSLVLLKRCVSEIFASLGEDMGPVK